MAIATETDLRNAIAAGGDIDVDSNVHINLTNTLQINNLCRIYGGNLRTPPGQPMFQLGVGADGFTIANARLYGSGSGNYQANERLIYGLGTKTTPLGGVTVHDCHLSDIDAEAMWLEWCTGAEVHSNTIEHFAYAAVMVCSGQRHRITNNNVSDGYVAPGQVEVYGIACTDLTNVVADRSTDIVIANNTIDRVDYEGIDTHGGLGIAITGNVITGTVRGIAMVGGNDTRIAAPTSVSVAGNVVNSVGARKALMEGITLQGVSGGNMASGTIIGNSVIGNYVPKITANHYLTADTYVGGNST